MDANQKKITLLKKQLRDKMIHYKPVFSRSFDRIHFDGGKNQITFSEHFDGLYVSLQTKDYYYHAIYNHLSDILSFFQEYALILGMKYIRITEFSDLHFTSIYNDHHFLDIDKQNLNYLFPVIRNSYTFIKILDHDWFKKKKNVISDYELYIGDLQHQDPTFTYYVKHDYFFDSHQFYYKGIKGEFKFENEFIRYLDQNYRIDNHDILSPIQSIFKSIETKQRIKNMFTPPKHHFETFLANKMTRVSREKRNECYNLLLATMTSEEIEVLFSQNPSFLPIYKYRLFDMYLLALRDDCYILFSSDMVYQFPSYELAKNKLYQLMFRETREYFSGNFVQWSEGIKDILHTYEQTMNGVFTGRQTDISFIPPLKSNGIRVEMILDRIVIIFGEQARSFSFEEQKQAYELFCQLVTNHYVEIYDEKCKNLFKFLLEV